MARRTQTYAIRLAVEGGGQVKAELVSVGQSGEQSLQRIETAGGKASGGLKGLGRQAELLRAGIRTLGGALAGVATVGGLAALVDRSISAADAIGETASKIGIGVEALQELRYAASLAGVQQQTLDMALQRFVRRVAEAANGTGEAKDALAQMGIALRDQSGNLRRSEDLLGDVADAFTRIEDPAERVRLAFKLFDSEGVALVKPAPGRQRRLGGDAGSSAGPRHRAGRAPGARCRAGAGRARHSLHEGKASWLVQPSHKLTLAAYRGELAGGAAPPTGRQRAGMLCPALRPRVYRHKVHHGSKVDTLIDIWPIDARRAI